MQLVGMMTFVDEASQWNVFLRERSQQLHRHRSILGGRNFRIAATRQIVNRNRHLALRQRTSSKGARKHQSRNNLLEFHLSCTYANNKLLIEFEAMRLLAVTLALTTVVSAAGLDKQDVQYGKPDGVPLLLDLHIPEGAGPFPAAILVHGGGFDQGSK